MQVEKNGIVLTDSRRLYNPKTQVQVGRTANGRLYDSKNRVIATQRGNTIYDSKNRPIIKVK